MSTAADSVIAALRAGHDELAAYVGKLTPEDLTKPSAASEWTIAQVLSHLGSGSEIALAALTASRDGTPKPAPDFNQGVWARWNAMSPGDQAAGFLESNERLVAAYQALDATTRRDLRIDLGFLPAPVEVATAARMRLNEFALHRWDIEAGFDPRATVSADAVPLLVDHVGAMLGWVAKPDALHGQEHLLAVHLTDLGRSLGLHLNGTVEVTEVPAEPGGELSLPSEAWLRLVYGRLGAQYNSDGVSVTGPLSLDDLRRVFPGF